MIQNIFLLYDTNGDNRIDNADIGEVVRAAGLNPTEAEIKKYINKGGSDLAKEQKPLNPEEFIEGFRTFDKECNGFVSSAEIRHLLSALGERLSTEEVDTILNGLENSQGLVTYEALVDRVLS